MKKFYFTLLLLLGFVSINAQRIITDYQVKAYTKGVRFQDVVAEVRAQLQTIEQGMANGSVQMGKEQFRELKARFERWVYHNYDRLLPDGSLAPGNYGWLNYLKEYPETIASQTQAKIRDTWTNFNPLSGYIQNDSTHANGWTYGYGIGRVNVVRRKAANTGILFAGTAAGGIFKSVNNGDSWTPITDQFVGLGVSDLVIDPNDTNTMYLATGDYDGSHMNATGIFKTTDGGATWAVTGLPFTLNENNRIAHILIDPTNSAVLYATTQFAVKKSTDAGATWMDRSPTTGTGVLYNDIVYIPGGTPRIYVTNKLGGTLHYTDNGGDTWTPITTGKEGQVRIDLSWSANTPDKLFLLAEANPAFRKLTISTNTFDAAWSTITTTAAAANAGFYAYNAQGGYNQVITANPTNGNDIIVGEFNAKRSTDGGTTWTDYWNGYYDPASTTDNWGGNYVHSDHHFIEFLPDTDSILNGNDGGVYIGTAGTNMKQKFNGLVATQSYSLAIFQNNSGFALLGNQDNDGFSRSLSGGAYKWFMAQAGDGTCSAIEKNDPNIRLLGGTEGKLSRVNDGHTATYSGTSIAPAGTTASFVFPLESHPQGNLHYAGYDAVQKYNVTANSWTVLFDPAGKVDYIELSNNTATTSKMYVINDSGDAFKSADEATFSAVTAPETGLTFKSISCSKTNLDSVFCTVTGYTAGKKVYFSTNGGGAWTDITGNLTNIKMDKIVLKQGSDTLFLGTELGLYFAKLPTSNHNNINWQKYGAGLPNVRISDIEINYVTQQLFVSTFGRGVWFIDLVANTPLSIEDLTFTSEKVKNADNKYTLNWHWKSDNVAKIELQRKGQNGNFITVKTVEKLTNTPDSYSVELTEDIEYYRIKGTYFSGKEEYSRVISLAGKGKGKTQIFPNPTVGAVNVLSTSDIKHVIVRDIAGRQITYATPNQNTYNIDLSFLPQGVYIVEVLNNDNVLTIEKVVVQRN